MPAIRAAAAGPRALGGDGQKTRAVARDLFDAAARHRTELVHAPFYGVRCVTLQTSAPTRSIHANCGRATSAGKPWAIAVARDLTGSASRLGWHLRWLARPIYKPIEDTNELFEPAWVFKDGKREVGPFRDGTLWDCYAIDPVQSVKKFTAVSFCFERGLLHPL